MSNGRSLAEEIQVIEHLDLEGLRTEWRQRFGAPPKIRSHDLVRRLLAWRIQAEAYGGLDAETRRLLRQNGAAPRGPKLTAGARIGREWKGVRYEVQVVEGGFVHAGDHYDSLSEIARAITGVRWNGPRFFGLRQEATA